jgi:beta-lactamase regulating signal transducer with metallopeptidase domain
VLGLGSGLRAAFDPQVAWLTREAATASIGFPEGTQLVLWIWLVPAALLMLRLGVTQLRIRSLLDDCDPVVSGPWCSDARRIGAHMGLRRLVVLLASRHLQSPVAVGALQPRVVIPESFLTATSSLRESVLWHELSHVRRHDVAGRWLAGVTCAIHWFNPLVWLAARRLRRECEYASDDVVLRSGVAGSTYARHLLALADATAPRPAQLVALGTGVSELRQRIEAIAEQRDRRELGAPMRLALTIVTLAMLLFALQLQFPQPRVLFIPGQPVETGRAATEPDQRK